MLQSKITEIHALLDQVENNPNFSRLDELSALFSAAFSQANLSLSEAGPMIAKLAKKGVSEAESATVTAEYLSGTAFAVH